MFSSQEKLFLAQLQEEGRPHITRDEAHDLQGRIEERLLGTDRAGMDILLRWLRHQTDYFTAPASSKYHEAFPGGLMKHSDLVHDSFTRLQHAYPEVEIDANSATIASYLHDLCKVGIYEIAESEGILKYRRKDDTLPLGHGEKSVILLQQFIRLTAPEQLMIRWHMGPYDPAWSSYREISRHPEIELFCAADNLASKVLLL